MKSTNSFRSRSSFSFCLVLLVALMGCQQDERTEEEKAKATATALKPVDQKGLTRTLDLLERLEALKLGLDAAVSEENVLPLPDKVRRVAVLLSDKSNCQLQSSSAQGKMKLGPIYSFVVDQSSATGLLCPLEYFSRPVQKEPKVVEGKDLDFTRIEANILMNTHVASAAQEIGLESLRLGLRSKSGATRDGRRQNNGVWTQSANVEGYVVTPDFGKTNVTYASSYLGRGPNYDIWSGFFKETLTLNFSDERVEIQITRREGGQSKGLSQVLLNNELLEGDLAERFLSLQLPFRVTE